MLWFSAPTRLTQTLGKGLRIKKYHEAMDLASAEAISRPFWEYSYTENVHVNIGGHPVLMMTSMNTRKNDWGHQKLLPLSTQVPCMHRVSILSSYRDFKETMSKVKLIGWNVSTRTTGFWRQEEVADQ